MNGEICVLSLVSHGGRYLLCQAMGVVLCALLVMHKKFIWNTWKPEKNA